MVKYLRALGATVKDLAQWFQLLLVMAGLVAFGLTASAMGWLG
jgi:hypothetical protein